MTSETTAQGDVAPRRTTKKRIIICCDGTWNKPDSANITNVEKIARSVAIDLDQTDGVQQLVGYIAGVGVGYRVDRILGGAFGYGLFNNVRTAYRFLALNFRPGDEVFAFGFSRGAYTARSLAGMVGTVGLLTRDGLVQGNLREALARYRSWPDLPEKTKDRKRDYLPKEEFRRRLCHPADVARITFLGVFDTVGALGVPSMLFSRHEFHNVNLGDGVVTARHALAIDEQRRIFEPCLWKVPEDNNEVSETHTRVKQVWFPGAHSDVGGGYEEEGLSLSALRWMTGEAEAAGLAFDKSLLDHYLEEPCKSRRHNSLSTAYRIANARDRLRRRPKDRKDYFVNGRRNLQPSLIAEDRSAARPLTLPVSLASVAHDDFNAGWNPSNVAAFVEQREGSPVASWVEPVSRLPAGSKPPTPEGARRRRRGR